MRWRPIKLLNHLLIFIALAVLVLLLQVVVLPRVVQHIILSKFAGIGLSELTLEVHSCSWLGAEIANVSLDEDRCCFVGSMSVQYSPKSLIQGKLKTIQINGGQLLLRIRDGKIALGGSEEFKFGTGESDFDPFFNRIELRACVLSVDWEQKCIFMPCDGSIVNTGDGRLEGDLNLNPQGVPLHLQFASVIDERSWSFSLEKKAVDVRTLLTALPKGAFNLPPRLAGRIDVKLEGSISGKDGLTACTLTAGNGWLKTALAASPVDAEGIECRLDVDLKEKSRPGKLSFDLTADAVRYGNVAADEFRFNMKKSVGGFAFLGSAKGEQWKLKSFDGLWPTDRGSPVKITWELEGCAPKSIAHRISDHGLDISKLGAMNISGHLLTNVSKTPGSALPDFEVPELKVVLAPGELKTGQTEAVLRGVSGVVGLKGNYKNGRSNFHVLPESWLECGSARAGDVTVEKTRLTLREAKGQSFIESTIDETGVKTQIHLEVSSAGTTVRAGKDTLAAKVNGARLSVDASLGPERATANGILAFEGVRYPLGSSGLLLALDGAVLKAQLNSGDAVDPTLETVLTLNAATLLNSRSETLFALDRDALKPIVGTYNRQRREGSVQLEWPLQENSILSANGSINFRGKQPSGFFSVACDGFQIEEEQAAIKLLANTTGLTVSGGVSLNGNLRLEHGHLAPRITIAATAATLSSPRYRTEAEGINGSITFTGFSPISTPGNQRLEIQSLKLGKLLLHDGLIAFCLENDPPAILVERAEWGCLGGRVYSRALRIDPSQPTMDARFFVDGLDIGQLFKLAFGASGTGSGSLYGMIPASISRSNPADFSIGEGFLYSTSRDGSWKLADQDAANMVQQILEQQFEKMFQQSVDVDVHDRIFSALRDFEYTLFKVDLIRREDGLLARITTRGHSRNQTVPVEFEEIVLDFPGFDENLRELMIIKTAVGQGLKQTAE